MSYSTLLEIEMCPLRWSLRRSQYNEISDAWGYPAAIRPATIGGQVVHHALEAIAESIQSVADDGIHSDGAVVAALRKLGGISSILELAAAKVLRSIEASPRSDTHASEFGIQLQRQFPALRQRVQQMLGQVVSLGFRMSARGGDSGKVAARRVRAFDSGRSVTRDGAYAELEMEDRALNWYGKADLTVIAGDTGVIIDFKTGAPKPDHDLQVRLYAWLFQRDTGINPEGKRVTELVVAYSDHILRIDAPTTSEMEELTSEIKGRTRAAIAAISSAPPTPRPSRSACSWCDVRQLCDHYWAPSVKLEIAQADAATEGALIAEGETNEDFNLADVEVRVSASRAQWSAVATVVQLGGLTERLELGMKVLVRARRGDPLFGLLYRAGSHVRIVGGRLVPASDESGGITVIELSQISETFLITN